MNTWRSKYFYGHQISKHGLEQKRLDYRTLSQAFDAVLNNNIMATTQSIGYWEQEHGFIDNSEQIHQLNDRIGELMLDNDEGEHDDEIDELQQEIDELYDEEERYNHEEIFQFYIVSDNGAEIIKDFTNDPLFYNEMLDMYVWGITHYGTSWDYVLTITELEIDEDC